VGQLPVKGAAVKVLQHTRMPLGMSFINRQVEFHP